MGLAMFVRLSLRLKERQKQREKCKAFVFVPDIV